MMLSPGPKGGVLYGVLPHSEEMLKAPYSKTL